MVDPIRLIIADDHALFRHGLIELLREQPDFEIVGEAQSGPEVIQLLAGQEADLVLMDVHMPAGGGIEAIKTLPAQMATC
jgi:two-component system nitrate/nitrite response regulator NarL